MTNYEISQKLEDLALRERKITREILELINVAFERRAYLDLGFASMFDWLTKGFGYSNASAWRRIEAARLFRAVPEVSAKIQTGEVNLSTLSKAQTLIRTQEKITGQRVSREAKVEVVQRIENKSIQEAEKILIGLFPEAGSSVHQERRSVLDANTTRHTMNFSNEAEADLKRAKEVHSHKFPNASDAEMIAFALSYLLERTDPLRKSRTSKKTDAQAERTEVERTPLASAAEATRVKSADAQLATRVGGGGGAETEVATKASVWRATLRSSNASCTFKDDVTGRVCGSRYQVQVDHIILKARGGNDEPANLRLLCRNHNLLMAERALGKKLMDTFRRPD